MATRNRRPQESMRTAVEMAIGSLDSHPSPSPLDMDMRDIGESPTDLDLTLPSKPDDRPDAAGQGERRRQG
jgi:hypothetical protein